RFHDQAVLLEPPRALVELPAGRRNARAREPLVAAEPHAARTGVLAPQAPRLGVVAGLGLGLGERRDVLRRHALELAVVDGGPRGCRQRAHRGRRRTVADERAAGQSDARLRSTNEIE